MLQFQNRFSWFRRGYFFGMLALVALFFVLCLPLLPSVSRWRGDERFYTDAAIGMTQNGNYFIPTYSDGTLRFKKPILTYWAVLLSYKALGISYLSSRLPFLVAGTLVVWLTYWFALLTLRRRPEALVAAAIIASNQTVMHMSIRSTPDMLLTLCLLISMIGFVRLVFKGERSLTPFVLAYLGAGLAVMTKGLFGLLPVAFVFGYVLIARPPGVKWRDLIQGPVMVTALAVAMSWFALAFFWHGSTAASDFLGDQVGERFSGSKWYILSNAGVYLASFLVQMLPWSICAAIPLIFVWQKRLRVFVSHRREMGFMVAWIVLLYVVFTLGNIQRARYFLAAFPQLAVLFAVLLCAGFRQSHARLYLRRIFQGFYWVLFALGVGLIYGGWKIDARLIAAGFIFAGLALILIRGITRWVPPVCLTAFGVSLLLVASVLDSMVRPVFFISAAPEMTHKILSVYPAGTPIAMRGVNLVYVSQIRVLSGGLITPQEISDTLTPADIRKFPLLVCPREDFESSVCGAGKVVGYVQGYIGWRSKEFLGVMSVKKWAKARAKRCQTFALVIPGPASGYSM